MLLLVKLIGDFEQNFDKHLSCNTPCKKCREDLSKRIFPKHTIREIKHKSYLNLLNIINLNFLEEDKVEIVYNSDKIYKSIIYYNCRYCSIRTSINYDSLSLGRKYISCIPCAKKLAGKSKTASFEDVCKELTTMYGNKHTYLELKDQPYKTKKSKILVTCKDHPDSPFERSVEKLKAGSKCSKCTFIESYKEGKFPRWVFRFFF